MHKRKLALDFADGHTCFLWGPRQTGKTTLLKALYPNAPYYDLLLSDEFRRLLQHPGLIRQEWLAARITGANQKDPIIIDEVQKVPEVLDEVHWLIENLKLRFILCGSSARKVRRGHANLLGGRAIRYELFPLVYPEIMDFSLDTAINSGLLPRHYGSPSARRLMESYVADYLQQEIAAEALTRNIPAFGRFLEVAALSNGEIINYQNIARECAVSAPTVKGYFQILEDTFVGRFMPAFRKRAKRRIVQAPKFYLFDVGITGQLARRGRVQPGSELFGRVFEHFICMEITAHASYSELKYPVAYWRTASGAEVDFVLGDAEAAIEVKSTSRANDQHLRGLRVFRDEYPGRRCILVSTDPRPRLTDDGILILPWREFLERLWGGQIVGQA